MSDQQWKIIKISIERYTAEREKLTCSIQGPHSATLRVQPELPSDYKSLTVQEIEDLAFAEAKRLYPS